MKSGFRNMAQRIVSAESAFIANVMERGFTKEEAEKVLRVYRKARVIRLDAVGGVYTVKHGAFWDIEVLRNAVNHK